MLIALAVSGCASQTYRQTPAGRFSGALDVRWVRSDYFMFVPNKDEPLTFTRADGRQIRPGVMYTDAGSIPRFLWGVPGLSPWGYAPAYIVHDWLFEARHCGYAPDNAFGFGETAAILAEGLKTVMEADPPSRDDFVFESIVSAVSSPIAQRLWEDGSCKAPVVDAKSLREPVGDLLMTIRFR